MWIESLCNDEKTIETNIRITKLSSPDYKDVDSEIVTSIPLLLSQNIRQHRTLDKELSNIKRYMKS